MTSILIKRRFETKRHRGEGLVKMEAETGCFPRNTGLHQKLQEARNEVSPKTSVENVALLTP